MEEYTTTDLGLAAYLSLGGFKFNLAVRGSKVIFVFNDDGGVVRKKVEEYFKGGEVSAVAYFQTIQNLKTMVINLRRLPKEKGGEL